MITQLLKHDLYLTYSWNPKDQGICGHVYEVIEYYTVLKEHINVGIFLGELSPKIFRKVIEDKYNFTVKEVNDIMDCTEYSYKPKLIRTTNILFCDGNMSSIDKITILADNIIMFACGDRSVQYLTHPKYHVLQDSRVYNESPRGTHYVKKLLFHRYKDSVSAPDVTMLYLTESSRSISHEDLEELMMYNPLILSEHNTFHKFEGQYTWMKPPVNNIFDKFNTYCYTSTPKKSDCSSRFLAECEFYNKEVIYYKIDYLDVDSGLRVRIDDIKNRFSTLFLRDTDEIIDIIKDIL